MAMFWVKGLVLVSAFALSLLSTPPSPVSLWDAAFWGGLLVLLAFSSVPLPLIGQVRLHFIGALAAAYALPPFWAVLLAALLIAMGALLVPLSGRGEGTRPLSEP